MLFIGHTRFSIYDPGSAAWLASNGSQFSGPEDYKAYLYSDERLGLRADVFINYSLPQLELAAKGHNIKHVVAYSDSLPEKYQRLLQDAANRFPFVLLERGDSTQKALLPGTSRWTDLLEASRGSNVCFGTYRLDDDDILPCDYFNQMEPYVTGPNIGMQISLGTGIAALYEDGHFKNVRGSYYPMFSAGLMNVCGIDVDGNLVQPSSAPHHLSDRTNPVILDSRRIGYMRLRHVTQDGTLRIGGSNYEGQRKRIIAQMDKGPAIAANSAPEISFPLLKDRIAADDAKENPTVVEVGHDSSLSSEPTMIPIAPRRNIRISVVLDCSDETSPRNALISFHFKTEDGDDLDRATYDDYFRQQGLSYSEITGIGFFRYLKTAPGRVRTELEVTLPDGTSCASVSIRRWKNHSSNIRIDSLSIG